VLGDALISSGAITASQLEQALADQRVTGALLGETLLALKFITDETLAKALAQEAGVPMASLAGRSPDVSAVELVPEPFARKHLLAPLALTGAVLQIAQANPFDVLALDDLRQLTGRAVVTTCATPNDVQALLDRAYRAAPKAVPIGEVASPIAPARVEPTEEARHLEQLIRKALATDATALHIEPDEDVIDVRYRIDGLLAAGDAMSRGQYVPLVTHIKALAGLDSGEAVPQDGHASQLVDGRRVDLLIATLPTTYGEKVAVRVLEKGKTVPALAELGLSRKDLTAVSELLDKPRGLLLVTGPGGSGTTTTLYSMLAHLGDASKNILTLEDPVERQIPSVRQTQIRPKSGFTFATAMRSVFRQDPDVVMIGEIRDPETAQMALRAAMSGILVLTTLPSDDAASAVSQLTDMGLEPYLLASGLVGVIAQRLIRRNCPACSERITYPADMLERVGLKPDPGLAFQRGRGCPACRGTGHRGRTGAFEVLTVDSAVQALIRERADAKSIKASAVNAGMKTLREDALAKAVFQQTTLEEVLRATQE
jgi:type IV pilus assembly protein PilB